MRASRSLRRAMVWLVYPVCLLLACLLVGCAERSPGPSAGASETAANSTSPDASGSPATSGSASPGDETVPLDTVRMARPAAFRGAVLAPDILVYSKDTLPDSVVKGIRSVKGIAAVDQFSMAQFFSEETPVTYAAVDPATFRQFTDTATAQSQTVWNRVAAGEMAVLPALGKKIQDRRDYVRMGNDTGAPLAHIGAYAPLVERADGKDVVQAVVNRKWASRLGMKTGNAMLIATGSTSPQSIRKRLVQAVGTVASVQILAVNLKTSGYQTAVLTGGSVSAELGTLRYTPNANGSVNPDPAWVGSFIRTESVPILGRVTCNRIMLPALRAALNDVVAQGLSGKIIKGQYGGCYVPRFIAGTGSLSFHTYGTAIDLNVPGNLRGTRGQMDRSVVRIFEKWGFEWGGTWRYTDPMHFELHKIVKVG